MLWLDDAKAVLDAYVDAQPVLVRISAAKRLRDQAERLARAAGVEVVTAERVLIARKAVMDGALV